MFFRFGVEARRARAGHVNGGFNVLQGLFHSLIVVNGLFENSEFSIPRNNRRRQIRGFHNNGAEQTQGVVVVQLVHGIAVERAPRGLAFWGSTLILFRKNGLLQFFGFFVNFFFVGLVGCKFGGGGSFFFVLLWRRLVFLLDGQVGFRRRSIGG